MAIAKVILNGETQMDVTQKTVTPASMLSGVTALKNDGTDITGDIESKTSSDLTVSGATVTAPAGHYASAASKSVASGSASTPATTITANPTVSVNSSGLITATVSKTQSVTPSVSAGYVASGTAGTVTVTGSGTSQLTTQTAQTIHPSTTDQTIASGKYLTGVQTIKAVTTTNLTAANIVQGVTVKVGDSTDDDCVASVTGTAETGGGGGDDFVITLTQNASTGIYEPDCTFAEAKAAYDAGKKVAFVASDMSPCAFLYDEDSNGFVYIVDVNYSGSNWQAFGQKLYVWTSTGVIVAEDPEQQSPPNYAYFTFNATALPADVASGKVFYNANGYQVGTASGGGGGGPTLLSSQTVELSCTSTSWTLLETLDVGTDVFYDGIVYVKIRDTAGRRAGYFYGSDSYIYNMHYISNLTTVTAAAVSNNIGWYCGTSTTNLAAARNNSQTTEQGYYGLRAIQANTDGELTIWGRYNTTYSRTIDSTYKVDVYLLPYPGGTFA